MKHLEITHQLGQVEPGEVNACFEEFLRGAARQTIINVVADFSILLRRLFRPKPILFPGHSTFSRLSVAVSRVALAHTLVRQYRHW